MSLFSTNEWLGLEFTSASALAVGDFFENRDQLIVGCESGQLTVVDPGNPAKERQCILQHFFPLPIIAIAVGNFVAASDQKLLAILLTRKLCVCHLYSENDEYKLSILNEHANHGLSYNMCVGRFGRSHTDLLCVQSLNCSLTIYEAEQALLTRTLPNILFPGPISYAVYSESIIVTSGEVLSSIRYNSLITATSGSQGKKPVADWSFALNDWAVGVDTAGSSTLQPSILALCKRNLYCFTQGGVLRFHIRLQCVATNLTAYGNAQTYLRFCIVANRTLLFYAQNVLIWTAKLQIESVELRLCTFGEEYRSMLAILSNERLSVGYLGTEPSVFCLPASQTRFIDFKKRQEELQKLEAVIKRKPVQKASGANNGDILRLDCTFRGVQDKTNDASLSEATEKFIVIDVSIKSPTSLRNVLLLCCTQFVVLKYLVINDENKEFSTCFHINLQSVSVSSCHCQFFVVSAEKGEVASCRVQIPLFFLCRAASTQRNAQYKFTIESSDAFLSISELFPGLNTNSNAWISLQPFFADTTVSVFASVKSTDVIFGIWIGHYRLLFLVRYRIQSDSLPLVCLMAEDLMFNIRAREPSAKFKCQHLLDVVIQALYSFIELERRKLKEQKDLENVCIQLRGAQASLLQRLKAPRPVSICHLSTLMEYTFEQIMLCVGRLTATEELLKSAKVTLEACLNLLCYYISLSGKTLPITAPIVCTSQQQTSERLKWIFPAADQIREDEEINKTDLRNWLYKQCQMSTLQMEDISEEEDEVEDEEPFDNAGLRSVVQTVVSGTIPVQHNLTDQI